MTDTHRRYGVSDAHRAGYPPFRGRGLRPRPAPRSVGELQAYRDTAQRPGKNWGPDVDLARWFPDEPRVDIPASTRPVEQFLAQLPPNAATVLAGFDRKVRSGTMAQFLEIYDWAYGFDFEADDCGILDSDSDTVPRGDDVWR